MQYKMSDVEVQEFLKETKMRLETQDNRATANPIWIVYDYQEVITDRGHEDDYCYTDEEGKIGKTREDVITYLKENDIEMPEDIGAMCEYEFESWLEEDCKEKIYRYSYKKIPNFVGVFFTEEAADNFIKANNYHYSKEVYTYVAALWRNYEMQTIRNLLLEGRFIKEE